MYMLLFVRIDAVDDECVEMYRNIGFEEEYGRKQVSEHETLVFMTNGITNLHIHINPLNLDTGIRYLCFRTEKLEGQCEADDLGKFRFMTDGKGQKIKVRELPPQMVSGDFLFDC